MKWLPVFAVSVLVGCAEVRIMDVDFVSNEVVVINGKRFPLRSRSDGCEVRKRFPAAEQLIFRNIRNCRFSSMWRLVDYKASDRDEDAARIGVIFYYYIVLRLETKIRLYQNLDQPFSKIHYQKGNQSRRDLHPILIQHGRCRVLYSGLSLMILLRLPLFLPGPLLLQSLHMRHLRPCAS